VSRIEDLEREIRALSVAELTQFREWFAEFDGAAWDREFEADVASGRLDRVAERAIEDYDAGRTRKL
jgi:hypothetical protein